MITALGGPEGMALGAALGAARASLTRPDSPQAFRAQNVQEYRQLIPGEPTRLRFSLTAIANLFRAGHRIELEVTSRPDLVATESGEGFDMFCWDAVPYWARNHIHHGGDAPSVLEIEAL